MLYLDHCATTPPYPEVIAAITEVLSKYYGNPSSIHHLGMQAEQLLHKSREVIAQALGCKAEGLIFTSGGTESNNLAIKGIAMQYQNRGRHLITTRIEHPSVTESFIQLEKMGYQVTYLPVDDSGQMRLEDLKLAITEDTILVSVMHVNNEMGRVQPVEEIGRFLRSHPRIFFHVDAVQSIGKLPFSPVEWGVDLFSASAHKIHGPKGVGLLYRRQGINLHPLLAGGGQEYGVRSGTENIPSIVGLAKAVRMTLENREQNTLRLYQLRSELLEQLNTVPGLVYNGSRDPQNMAPHIVNISLPGLKPEVVVHALENHDIYISTRSACSSKEDEPNKVLLAMGIDRQLCSSALRISFSAEHQMKDMKVLADRLKQVVQEVR